MMKKILAVFAGVVVLFLSAAIIIPLVIDVDKYRPQIVKAANERMKGSFELGKLTLSLWGKIYIQIDGLKVKDSQGHQVVAVKDASFTLPYSSVFSGSPLVTLSMKQPEIFVIKSKEGKLNVMSLMKTSAADATTGASTSGAAAGNGASASGTAGSKKVELPSMALNAHVGVFIEKAKLVYKDEATALSSTFDDFNFRVKDFSISRATELEIWAELKTTMGKDLLVQGSLKLTAELKPEISGGEFKSATVVANFNADDLEIKKGELFHKAKGDATHFKFNGKLSQEALMLTEAVAAFHNAEITVTGDYHKENGANIVFKSKPINLKSWSDLIPMLKEYDLDGNLNISGFVKGKPEALNYQANLGVVNLSAKGPNLKAKPIINGEIIVAPDRVEKIAFDVKGPGSDIKLVGKMNSFTKPQIQFLLKSDSGMDLDQWMIFPKKAEASATKSAPAVKGAAGGGGASGDSAAVAPADDKDAMLDSLRKNEMAKEMTIDGDVNISFMKAMGVRVDNIAAKIQMKNLVMAVTNIGLKIFDGTAKGSFTTDLKPAHPAYTMKFGISGFDMSKAVESQLSSFKNTMTGKLTANVEGGGSSFNTEMATKRLQMKGNFQMANAQFKTIDIAKAVNEALNATVAKLGDKIPGLKGKKVTMSNNGQSRYELVSSSFTIQNGDLVAPDFVAKAAPKNGVDLKGYTKMGMIDESLDAKWEVIDHQHVTGADQVNVDIGGKMIKNILAKGENDPVILPIKVGCKLSAPCASYTEVPEYLAAVALGRVTKGAGEVAKAKAATAVQDAVKKNIGGKAAEQIGSGLKKLFGN